MQKYEKGPRVGNGTYATVYRATVRETGETVAFKKLRQEAVSGTQHCSGAGGQVPGVSQAALREIKALKVRLAVMRQVVAPFCVGTYAV